MPGVLFWQAKTPTWVVARQLVPAQQAVAPVPPGMQVAPSARHIGAVAQVNLPIAPGTQGARLQHWSRN
jgi:hypothetical protein